MIDYMFSDRLFEELARKLIVPAFRKFALTYSVSNSTAYDVMECCYDSVVMQEESEATRKDMVDNLRRRLVRIIEQLQTNEEASKDTKQLYVAKIYDCKLNEEMVRAYYNIVGKLGDTELMMFSEKTILRNLNIENRQGFSFVEFAMLLCLVLSVRGRSLKKLIEPMDTDNKQKRAIARFRKIKDTLFSKQFEHVLMDLMLDLLAEYHQADYEDIYNRHIRDYWLPTSKRKLKTAEYATQRYGNKIISSNVYPREEYEKLSDVEQLKLVEDNSVVMLYQRLFYVIVPVIEALIVGAIPVDIGLVNKRQDGDHIPIQINLREYLLTSLEIPASTKEHIRNMPESYYTVSCEDYVVAVRIYKIMKQYYYEVQKAIVSLLEVLPGSQFVGDCGLWDYLINL